MTDFERLLRVAARMAFAASLVSAIPALADGTGQSGEIQYPGNPSTGYTWTYNPEKSENPGIAQVEALGFGDPDSRMIGAPAPYIFRITCLKSGFATLFFEHVAPDRRTIGDTHKDEIRCD
jgi:hypothetical protein